MTEKEKVVFFVDYASINRVAREKRYRLDYGDLLHYIGEDRFLVDAYCYVPINPSAEEFRFRLQALPATISSSRSILPLVGDRLFNRGPPSDPLRKTIPTELTI